MTTTAPETPSAMSLGNPPNPESATAQPAPPPAGALTGGARVPSLRTISDPSNTTPSSTPLGPLQAARQGPIPRQPSSTPFAKSGGIPQDVQARLKAFQQSRMNSVPNMGSNMGSSTGIPGMPHMPSMPAGMPTPYGGGSPSNGPGGRMNARPMAPPNWSSAPAIAGRGPPKPSLGQRRGLKLPGGLPGASPSPAPSSNGADASNGDGSAPQPAGGQDSQGSLFDKYSRFVDTKSGSLKFAGKAVLHGHGVEFSSGSSFSISLDEIDKLEELGKGNYGTVYKVIHRRPSRLQRRSSSAGLPSEEKPDAAPTTGIQMAMKEIRLELDENKFAQIIMELDILHRCRSPYIIDFYGAFFQEGAVYICMEFMEGGSIDKLYRGGVKEEVLRRIAHATVQGLKTLKEDHNIIHRDVKPTNILVNGRGDVKLCDFGVSGNLVASIAKTNIGCQSYMAPERISSGGAPVGAGAAGTYGVQSDVWSLGLSIVECAVGSYPYPPETYNNIFSQLSAIVDGDPPDLPADKFSDTARDFVRKCLHKIPSQRPSYAQLLRHPWISDLAKPAAIAEDEEENAEVPVPSSVGDPIVKEWVVGAIEARKAALESGDKGPSKPALHAAPLDAVSPAQETGVDAVTNGVEGLSAG